jgi:hypothetical protein
VVSATTNTGTPRTPGQDPTAENRRRQSGLRFVLATFGLCAVAFFLVANYSAARLPMSQVIPEHGFPDHHLFDGWTRWDTDWYQSIAQRGYYYEGPGRQASVAFFPGYPAAMKAAMVVVRDPLVAGVVVTYLAGLAAAFLFFRFCRAAFGERAGSVGVLVLLLYPFSLFLFGAVYSDALFLATALGAFLLLEHDRPWLAGLAGALATASRPVGLAVAAGLALRALELRGVLPGGPPRLDGRVPGVAARHRTPLLPWPVQLRRLSLRDAGVLVSVLGLAAFCGLLWWRFDEPLAFARVQNANGWARGLNAETFFKHDFFRHYLHGHALGIPDFIVGVNGFVTMLLLALVPLVIRRLGWAYGLYSLAVILVPASSSREFIAMGRHALAAFPCFAVGAALLAGAGRARFRPALAAAWLIPSGAAAVAMCSLFARWYLL